MPVPRTSLRNSFQRSAISVAVLAGLGLCASAASAQTWNNPNSGNWSVGSNWVGNAPPSPSATTALIFNATGAQTYTATNNIIDPFTLNSLSFGNSGSGVINLNGSGVLFSGANPAINQNGAGNVTSTNAIFALNSNLNFGGSGAGTVSLSGFMTFSGATTLAAGGTSLVNSNSSGRLVISGGGSMYSLQGNTGNTFVQGGIWNFTSSEMGPDQSIGGFGTGLPAIVAGNGGGNGQVTISNGAQVTANFVLAAQTANSTGTVTVTGAGTVLNAGSVGVNYGTGTVQVLNGGVINTTFGLNGLQAGSNATLLIDGAGSRYSASREFDQPFGGPGAGTTTISNGGQLSVTGQANLGFAIDSTGITVGSTSRTTISGANSRFDVTSGQLPGVAYVGIGTDTSAAVSTLTINSGGQMNVQGALFGDSLGQAIVTIDGVNSRFTSAGELGAGSTTGNTINVQNSGQLIVNGPVFWSPTTGDKLTMNVNGGLADFSAGAGAVFSGGGGGNAGSTTINISGGGELRSKLIRAAENSNSLAVLTVSGLNSRLTLQGPSGSPQLIMANDAGANAQLTVSAGGQLSMGPTSAARAAVFLAPNSGASGSVTITGAGSALTTGSAGSDFYVGADFDGVQIVNGGVATLDILSSASADLGQGALIVGTRGTTNVGSGTTPATLRTGAMNVNGTVNYNSGTLSTGTLAVGGTVFLSSRGTSNKKLLEVGTLALSGSGVIDLNDNDAIFHSTPLNAVVQQIRTARNNGAWNQPGITSTAARNRVPKNTTLGTNTGLQYKANDPSRTFNGLPVADSDVIVKYTFYGDADLNGRVNFDDYARIDTGFNNHLTGWYNGDFDGNGIVNFDDYTLIDGAFNTQIGVFARPGPFQLAGPGDRTILPVDVSDTDWSMQSEIDAIRTLIANRPTAPMPISVPEPGAAMTGISLTALALRRRRSN